jgi:hypothetical protein
MPGSRKSAGQGSRNALNRDTPTVRHALTCRVDLRSPVNRALKHIPRIATNECAIRAPIKVRESRLARDWLRLNQLEAKNCVISATRSVFHEGDTFSGNREGCARDSARVIHLMREGRCQIMQWRGFFAIHGVVWALSCTSDCTVMPTSGSAVEDVQAGTTKPVSLAYELVRLTSQVVQILSVNAPSFASVFTVRRVPAEIRFGVGDVVAITIFEAAAGGLIPPKLAFGRAISLRCPIRLCHSGNISVPYSSAIRALGRTPPEVQQAICSQEPGDRAASRRFPCRPADFVDQHTWRSQSDCPLPG